MNLKRFMLVGLKLAVGIGLLAFLFSQIRLVEAWQAMHGASPLFLLAAFASYLGASLFEIAKFRAACESRPGWIASARLVEMGLFFNNFLPSNIGGDGYKLFRLKQSGFSAAAGVVYLLADRMAGAVVLVVTGAACWLLTADGRAVLDPALFTPFIPGWSHALLVASALLAVMLLGVYLLRAKVRHVMHRIEPLFHAGIGYLRRTAPQVLLLSTCFHVLRGVAIHFLARAFGFDVPLASVMVMLGVALTASMLPISLGGLGVREGTFTLLLKHAGIPSGATLAIVLLNLLVMWIKSLIGGLIFLHERHTQPRPVPEQP